MARPDYLAIAQQHGAKIDQAESGLWRVLDQTNSILWHAWFLTEDTAAWGYCFQHHLAGL